MHTTTLKPAGRSMGQMTRDVVSLFKLRIGTLIMITALAGMAISGGPSLSLAQVLVLALSVLAARIRDAQEREQHAKIASERKSLVGSGDRSERIRTYNFPQGRVTDHRINLTLYKIDSIMDGDLDEIIGALTTEHQAEQLAALADSEQ